MFPIIFASEIDEDSFFYIVRKSIYWIFWASNFCYIIILICDFPSFSFFRQVMEAGEGDTLLE